MNILKKVMAFTTGKLNVLSQPEKSKSLNELNTQEIEFLLTMIKNATFKGEHIEVVYNTIIKLQNKYLEQTK
jgi:hypothetical protein